MIRLTANKIFLKFGNNCNLHCEYCLHNVNTRNNLNYEFDKNIISYLNSDYITSMQSKIRLILVGGEPLLYWNNILYVLEHINHNKFSISITTNGKLLNDDIINTCSKYSCRFTISWDGTASSKTRGYDVILDKEKYLYKIKTLGFSSLLTSESLLLDKFEVFHNIWKNYLKYNGYTINNINIKPVYNYMYSDNCLNQLQEEINVIKEKMYTYNKNSFEYYYIDKIKNKCNNTTNEYYCGSNTEDYTLKSDGYFLYCSADLTNINLKYTDNIFTIKPEKNIFFDKCNTCNIKNKCDKFCKYMVNNIDMMNNFCLFNKILYENLGVF